MNRKARHGGGKPGKGPDPQAVQQLVGLCRAQRFAEATPLAREFTRRWPKHAVGWHALAACAQAAGDTDEAIRAYRRALSIEPDNPDAHNNLGLLLADSGDPAEASKSYRRALRIRPGSAITHYNLGLALEALDRLDEAADCHRRALEIEPRFAEAHNHLGNVLRRLGRPAEAEACYRRVLELQPEYAEVYSNLGNVLAEQGALAEAESCHRRALELRPGFAEAHANLGRLLRETGRLVESERTLRRALELRPDDSGLQAHLAATLLEQGRVDAAEALYRQALARQPDTAETHENLANALADRGALEEAAAEYRQALSLQPGRAQTWYHLSLVKRFERDDPDRDAIEAALERDDLVERDRVYLEYAAGKAWADLGDEPDRAFAHYAAGAREQRGLLDYDVAADEARMASIARVFDAQQLEALAGQGHDSAAPIFIVGMPRSGTTLIEQILASHPRVHGAGERPDLGALVELAGRERDGDFPDWLADLPPGECERLGRAYCDAVVAPVADADRVTDKMPSNFLYAGLIRAILPRARLIHVRREPADTCVSCFTYLFSGRQAFTYDLAELGRYYCAYDALMAHWRAVLPGEFLLELRYEDLVDDPHTWIGHMLAHCGLEWDDACLQFHRSDRAVRTASAQQVREPLYRRAVGRWKPYRAHLGPLLEALGPLAPEDA